MVLPIYDTDPLESDRISWVTYALIAINTLIFLLVFGTSLSYDMQWTSRFALVPQTFWREFRFDAALASHLTLLSSLFFHHGWLHFASNMLFLWVFGDNIEDAFGRVRYLIFYLLCGVSGGLAYAVQVPDSTMPLVGASSGIAGIVAAYALLRPCAKIEVIVFVYPITIDAYIVIAAWLLFQVAHLLDHTQGGSAWAAHVGGFLAGVVLTFVMRPPHLKLFECTHPSATSDARITAQTGTTRDS